MCAPSIDTSGQQRNARVSADIAREQWDYAKGTLMPYYMDRQERLDDLTGQVTDAQLGIQRQAADQALDLYNYQRDTFRPVEQSIVAEAMRDSTPEAYQRLAADAAARTGMAFTNSMAAAERDLRGRGVSAGSARGVSASRQAAISAALAGGAQFNNAYDQAQQRGYARKLDAAGLGRNLSGASTAAYGAATGAGSAAAGAGNDASRTAASTIGTGVQYGQLSAQSMGNSINANNSVMQTQAAQGDPFTEILGTGLGIWAGKGFPTSDKRKKRGISRVKPSALEAIEDTPVSQWKYREDVTDLDGRELDSETTHVGPMAQDVRRTMGEAAAPGGKVLALGVVRGKQDDALAELEHELAEVAQELRSLRG